MRTIVLRKSSVSLGELESVRPMGAGEELPPSAITLDITDQPAHIANADPNTIAVGDGEMPMQLIQPFLAAETAAGAPPTVSWGVEAVGTAVDNPQCDGKGVTVAILDTGIDRSHPAFVGVSFAADDLKDFTGQSPANDPVRDENGHGTHCAGTIFGRDVNGTRIGIARGVTRAIVGKVIGDKGGTTESIINAILWAHQRGAQVISMSVGMDFIGYRELLAARGIPAKQATSVALAGYVANIRLFDALSDLLSQKNPLLPSAVLVAAAGNESERPNFAIGVAPPAAGGRFVSVAALGPGAAAGRFNVASFSNQGARIAGPGVDIWSARVGGGLRAISGTSMATPHVAGVAALWIQKLTGGGKRPDAETVIEEMQRGALDLSDHLPREDIGVGLARAPAPLIA